MVLAALIQMEVSISFHWNQTEGPAVDLKMMTQLQVLCLMQPTWCSEICANCCRYFK